MGQHSEEHNNNKVLWCQNNAPIYREVGPNKEPTNSDRFSPLRSPCDVTETLACDWFPDTGLKCHWLLVSVLAPDWSARSRVLVQEVAGLMLPGGSFANTYNSQNRLLFLTK